MEHIVVQRAAFLPGSSGLLIQSYRLAVATSEGDQSLSKPADEFRPSTSRIEAFSDGVFAIVLTLLVLDLRVPKLADGYTERDLFNALVDLGPRLVGFFVSFLVIAIFWVNHHQLFHSLARASRALLWHNNHLLFWMCVIPFPTAFLGEYHDRVVPVMLYGFVLFMGGVAFNLVLRHAVRAGLFDPTHSSESLRKAVRRGVIGPIVYAAAVLLALVSVYIPLVLFIVVPLLYFIPQKIVRGE